ncbi:hypothetical protein [Corynebacterium glaucum]|uniref:hypothetical protein n=1 Tax=Corynebacterium glaucum TaxID=187491 RepID=UPI0025B4BA2A|nr:hypothetical protein [Corynebacterium glaucum]WJZ07010.1 hypothetical protein CGLAUT_02520 [Corynebacterium glaucum]
MKLFLSTFSRATIATAYIGALLALPFGRFALPFSRFFFGDGSIWTVLGGVVLAALFAAAASDWPALNQLGTSFNRWMNSGAVTALAASVVPALVTTASSVVNQYRSPYYKAYDLFLITNRETVHHVDAVGDEYLVDFAGQDARTIALTFLATFLFFVLACMTGIALGLAAAAHRVWVPIVGAVIASVGHAAAYKLVADATYLRLEDGVRLPDPQSTAATPAAVATLVSGLIIAGFVWFVFARTQRFVK